MSVAGLTPRVREALGVSSSYDAETIPALIRRSIKRLLRDYHFPKSLIREDFTELFINSDEFTLPDGFKKEYRVNFYDDSSGVDYWSDPLFKSETFRLPQPDGFPRYYWLEGTKLKTDTPLPESMVGFTLQLYYESWSVDDNETWFTEDFEDVLFYHSVFRGAAEMRKPEVMQAFAPLWMDEQQSLAIYTNELEFDNLEIRMREPSRQIVERYPRS